MIINTLMRNIRFDGTVYKLVPIMTATITTQQQPLPAADVWETRS